MGWGGACDLELPAQAKHGCSTDAHSRSKAACRQACCSAGLPRSQPRQPANRTGQPANRPAASKQVASSTPCARARMAMCDSTSVVEEVSTATMPSCTGAGAGCWGKTEGRGRQAGTVPSCMQQGGVDMSAAGGSARLSQAGGEEASAGPLPAAVAVARTPSKQPVPRPLPREFERGELTGMSSLPVSFSATTTWGESKRWPCSKQARKRGRGEETGDSATLGGRAQAPATVLALPRRLHPAVLHCAAPSQASQAVQQQQETEKTITLQAAQRTSSTC